MLMKVDWGEIAQWVKFWMSSDSGLPHSECPVIGGIKNGNVWQLDRQKLTIGVGDNSYYLQEIDIDGEMFTAYRADGLSDRDHKTMLKSWLARRYEKKIEELLEKEVEIG
jgi:hypothetical protein|tara:strand:+ start:2194 stop:2523 length:330 start_codon:yes stop_codon:yes gene_type:complete